MPRFPQTTNFPIMTPQSQPTVHGSWVEPMGHNNPFVPDPAEAINPAYYNPQWAGPYSPGPNFYHPDYPYVGNANPLPGPSHPGYPINQLPKYQPKNPAPPAPSPFPNPGGRGGQREPMWPGKTDDTPMSDPPFPREPLIPGLRDDGRGGQRPPVFPHGKGMGGGQAPAPGRNPFDKAPAEDPFGNPLPPLQGALNGTSGPRSFPRLPVQGGR